MIVGRDKQLTNNSLYISFLKLNDTVTKFHVKKKIPLYEMELCHWKIDGKNKWQNYLGLHFFYELKELLGVEQDINQTYKQGGPYYLHKLGK